MMKPVKIHFYLYAENDEEAVELEKTLHDFVDGQYRKGALVTAGKVSEAVRRFGGGFLVSDFLKR